MEVATRGSHLLRQVFFCASERYLYVKQSLYNSEKKQNKTKQTQNSLQPQKRKVPHKGLDLASRLYVQKLPARLNEADLTTQLEVCKLSRVCVVDVFLLVSVVLLFRSCSWSCFHFVFPLVFFLDLDIRLILIGECFSHNFQRLEINGDMYRYTEAFCHYS